MSEYDMQRKVTKITVKVNAPPPRLSMILIPLIIMQYNQRCIKLAKDRSDHYGKP